PRRVRADLPRRHPLVLGAAVPAEAGHGPRPGQHLPGDHHRGGHLPGQVRRALRRLPRADAVPGAGRLPGRVRRPHRVAPRRRQDRTARPRPPPVPAAVRPAAQAARLPRTSGRGSLSMATITTPPATDTSPKPAAEPGAWVRKLVSILTTTDHKVIGNLYFVTTMAWFLVGGLMALVIRAE